MTVLGRRGNAAAPTTLVKAVRCDALAGEIGKQPVVAIYVVIEAMDKNDLSFRRAIGLQA